MRIVILTVGNNYHAPVLLRELLPRLGQDEIAVYISRKAERLSFGRAMKVYGLPYMVHKVLERLKYRWLVWRESQSVSDIGDRQYVRLGDVLAANSIEPRFTENINEELDGIAALQPDMLVSLYFDQIIRAPILSLPGCTSINLHPSLLPAYGGSSPTFHAMARGETATGITIHELTDVVDAGRILYQQDIVIDDEDTQFSLYRRCTEEFLQPLLSCIEAVRSGDEFPHMTARQSVKASYYTKISREELTSFLAAGRKFI